ncbi:MAG: nuclease-related domain-containing protein [Solirubrobacterales bacterium]
MAGASSRREYERRRAQREDQTRKRHPHIGNLLLRLRGAPVHEKVWEIGAAGEEALAAYLARHCPDAIILHDRRIPGSRANIDHLAITASGVHVIDSKRYKGKIEVRKRWFRDPKLFIRGWDNTRLIEGLERQRDAVELALKPVAPRVPVQACLCFISPEGQSGGPKLPLLRTLRIKEYPLLVPWKLAKLLKKRGELGPEQIRLIADALARRLPAA